MPMEDFGRVLDSIARSENPHEVMINVTGGEPLMRPDLEQCGRMMYDKGFPWGMVSNGFALTEKRYLGLLGSGLRAMTISLDGIGETHEWMRGREGSFERAARAIKMVIDSGGIEFDVVTCVNRRSYPQLIEIKEYLIGLGLKEWRLFTVFPVGRAAADPELQLSREEFRGLMDFIRDTRREGRIKASYGCEGFLGNYEGDVRDGFFICRAGISVGGILSDGSISACPSIRADYHQGNIYQDDFMEVWNTRFQPYRDHSWMREKQPCSACKMWKYCRGGGMHLRDSQGNLLFCHLDRL
jgi:radical SAM enzyme (rSAM/lipoprotein system)